jgi:hypothetical protein
MSDATPAGGAPTVLLVQGGFADGSSRAGVINALRNTKARVPGPLENPPRCLATDSDYIASAINITDGRCSPSATPTAAR